AFLRWESRIAHPIVQIALFRNRAFAAITLAGVLMYLVSFSVLLIVPYFFVRYTALPLPLAGALLATGFAAMAAVSPGAGWLVSLSMLTRTSGVVTAAAGLTLACEALQGAASAQGGGEAEAFLSACRNLFHTVGIAAALAGAMVAWAARRPR